jgi:hypothetical protein
MSPSTDEIEFHSFRLISGVDGSRPSISTSVRRVIELLKPRMLMLKSFAPLCTTSTPGRCSIVLAIEPCDSAR